LVVRKGGGSSLNNDRLCYINVDDNPDPLFELGRLVPIQLAWSLNGKRAPLVQEGKLEDAMVLADKLVRWAPKNGAHRIHQGFLAYLTGDKQKALDAFRKAMELDPNAFKSSFDAAAGSSATAVYKKVLDDKEFVAKLPQ
jgi:tetratricopeptide (TPR) repeat protein